MADDITISADEIRVAARELRESAGTDDQAETRRSQLPADGEYTTVEAIEALAEEIRLLRERGFPDRQIADLLTGYDIPVTAEEVAKHTPAPRLV